MKENTKVRPSTENLDDKDGDLEEDDTPAEAAVASLGSVSGGALDFLTPVTSKYDVEK